MVRKRVAKIDRRIWQDGWCVVASATSTWPELCVACGLPTEQIVIEDMPVPKRLIRGPVGAALFLAASERFAIKYGRCDKHRVPWARILGITAAFTTVVGMVGTVVSLMAYNGYFRPIEVVFGATSVVSLVTLIWAAMTHPRIWKAKDGRVWVTGFGRGYRANLPAYASIAADRDASTAAEL